MVNERSNCGSQRTLGFPSVLGARPGYLFTLCYIVSLSLSLSLSHPSFFPSPLFIRGKVKNSFRGVHQIWSALEKIANFQLLVSAGPLCKKRGKQNKSCYRYRTFFCYLFMFECQIQKRFSHVSITASRKKSEEPKLSSKRNHQHNLFFPARYEWHSFI